MVKIQPKALSPLRITPASYLAPQVNYLALEVGENRLIARAYTGEETIQLMLPVESNEQWRTMIPRVFLDVLDQTKNEVGLTYINQGVEVVSGSFAAQVNAVAMDDDEGYRPLKNPQTQELAVSEFRTALESVIYAGAGSFDRIKESVYLCDYAVATNGYRLAYYKLSVEFPGLIVPYKSVRHLIRLLQGETGTIRVLWANGVIRFETAQMSLQTRLVSGQYPAWKRVIPPVVSSDLTMDKKAALDALTALKGLKGNTLEVQVKDGQIIFLVKGDAGSGTMVVGTSEVADCTWSVAPKYLADALSLVQNNVVVQLNESVVALREGNYNAVIVLRKPS